MRKFDPRVFRKRFILVDSNTIPETEKMNCVSCGSLETELFEMNMFCKSCLMKWKEANDLICDRCTAEMNGQNVESICRKCKTSRSFAMTEMLI